jgi:hypothetical protein
MRLRHVTYSFGAISGESVFPFSSVDLRCSCKGEAVKENSNDMLRSDRFA